MKKIVLLRHTKTAFNSDPIRLRGGLDVPLSREGFAQIPDVTERFKAAYPEVKAVYSSPLERAAIIALAIAHEYDLKVTKCPELSSWDYGVLNGRPVNEVVSVLQTLSTGPGRDLAPEGGESMNHFLTRLTTKIKDIINTAPETGVVVIVSHLQNLLMGRAWLKLGLPDDISTMPYEYSEVNEINPGEWLEVRREWIEVNNV